MCPETMLLGKTGKREDLNGFQAPESVFFSGISNLFVFLPITYLRGNSPNQYKWL
jgi:hypothetical protein